MYIYIHMYIYIYICTYIHQASAYTAGAVMLDYLEEDLQQVVLRHLPYV